jgi:hypothetical protein
MYEMRSFVLIALNDRRLSSVLAKDKHEALVKLARVLEIDRLTFCTREQSEYLLEMLSDDWSEIEVTWTVRSSTGADELRPITP